MASLCEWIPVNAELLTTEITAPQTLLSNTFLSKGLLCISLKQTGFANAKQVSLGYLRDDRPPHGRPMAALWHPCHRGICESIHIRRGGPASKDGLEQYPCSTTSSPTMALVHKLRNPRFLFTASMSECHGSRLICG